MNILNWWNSKDAISFASTISQVAVALIGIIALILGIRSSQLQDRQQQQSILDIANAKKEAANANQRTQELERGTATLTKEAWQAKLELEQLKQNTAPRTLIGSQKQAIINYLKAAPKRPTRVISLSNSQEAMAYAKDIRTCLDEAGFADPHNSAPERIVGLTVNTEGNNSLVVAYHSEAEVYEDFSKENG